MAKGLYHRKLVRIFVSIAIVIVVLMTLLFSILTVSLVNSRNAAIESSIQSQFSMAKTSLSVIHNTLGNLIVSPVTSNWAMEDVGTSEYYLRTIKLYQELQHLTCQLNDREYEIVITSANPDTFLITKNGTAPKEWHFSNDSPLSLEQALDAIDYISSGRRSLLIPFYNQEGTLETLVYCLKASYYGHDVFFFVYIPASTLFNNSDNMPYFIIGPNEHFIYNDNEVLSRQKIDTLLDSVPVSSITGKQEISNLLDKAYLDRIEEIGMTIGFIASNYNRLSNGWIIFFILCILLLTICALLVAFTITRKLYAPINDVFSTQQESILEEEQSGLEGKSQPIDEFAIFKGMGDRVNELTQELYELTSQQDQSIQHDYRILLAGTVTTDTNDNDYFGIALFEAEESQVEDYAFNLVSLQANANAATYFEFLSLTPSLNVLVFQSDADVQNPETIFMDNIKTLLEDSNNIDNFKVAVSDIVKGKHNVYRAYRQAQVILEYKRIYPDINLLTNEYISSSASEDFYYPSSVEQTLLNYMVNGSPNAIRLYDEIIHENTKLKSLPGPTYQHFIFVLSGTFLRLFQELKTTPEELIGDSIDWLDLYTQWNKPEALKRLREILVRIINAEKNTTTNEDEKLTEKMKTYIHTHYMYDIMLQDLAKTFNITPKYCSTLFKKLSNDTFKNYLNQYRIEKACQIIKKTPQIKINELSLDVGFNSATSFIRVFNKYTGISPKAYADKVVAASQE